MLSDMQRNIPKQIESATNEETKLRPKIYQNRIMTEIHRESEEEENVKVRTIAWFRVQLTISLTSGK